jgi:hypothetical protein
LAVAHQLSSSPLPQEAVMMGDLLPEDVHGIRQKFVHIPAKLADRMT